jgi:hypothetical protein
MSTTPSAANMPDDSSAAEADGSTIEETSAMTSGVPTAIEPADVAPPEATPTEPLKSVQATEPIEPIEPIQDTTPVEPAQTGLPIDVRFADPAEPGLTPGESPSGSVVTEKPVRASFRASTFVWGIIVTVIGAGILARGLGADFDNELALIVLLCAAGCALVFTSLYSAIRRR